MRKDLKEVKREACRDLEKEGTRQRKRQVQSSEEASGAEEIVRGEVGGGKGRAGTGQSVQRLVVMGRTLTFAMSEVGTKERS